MNNHSLSGTNPSYTGRRDDLLNLLPPASRIVLDLGCSEGAFGLSVKERSPDAVVCGVEIDKAAASLASKVLDDVFVGDTESPAFMKWAEHYQFDTVVCGDVLEHMEDPWTLIDKLVQRCTVSNAFFIASIPNVAHWSTLYSVWIRGRWPRNSRGIHDATHLRWFTEADAIELFQNHGIEVLEVVRKTRLMETIHPWNGGWVEKVLAKVLGKLLVHQVLVTGRKVR